MGHTPVLLENELTARGDISRAAGSPTKQEET